ncbi:MAG: sensor histidine kinase [Lewinella sp.]|jgi:sensor histidine kinase YesM|uniref:sensor histidine kinase n=1 Tax=Lewinella sp. TaxID=2004506 RepID=UPI003D6A36B1
MQKVLSYSKATIKPFIGGCVVFGIIGLLTGWSPNASFFWETLRSGFLTALIWVGNGALSNEVKISWTDYPVKRLLISLLLTIVVTLFIAVFVDVVFTLLRYGHLPRRVFALQPGFYWSLLLITFVISMFLHGRSFLLSYRQAIVEQEELKRANLASKYESLQNQVNPHFLFNSLNVLSNLVYKDADLSAKFIEQLAQVYRYVLEAQDKEVVSLVSEKEMLESYLFLLKIRFGDQLLVELDVEAEASDALPPLSLQMLAENAIKHNIVSRRKPLKLVIKKEGNRIIVRNNFQPKQQEQTSLGVGLNNIRQRYALLSDQLLEINEGPDYYQVSLPVLKITEYAHSDR